MDSEVCPGRPTCTSCRWTDVQECRAGSAEKKKLLLMMKAGCLRDLERDVHVIWRLVLWGGHMALRVLWGTSGSVSFAEKTPFVRTHFVPLLTINSKRAGLKYSRFSCHI